MTSQLRIKLTRWFSAALLSVFVLFAVLHSLRWPLVGDAALMHYVVFAMRSGLVPYRDVVDVNMPGAYFFEWLGMHLFGSGALGWRFYDFALLVSIFAASVLLARRLASGWAGCIAAMLFTLVHFQDGIFQVGQRDLVLASLFLWAYVALFAAQSGGVPLRSLGLFGLAIGASATIKPVLLPVGLVLLCLAALQMRKTVALGRSLTSGLAGMLVPVGCACGWLVWYGAFRPFLALVRGLDALHASLGRQPVAYLLVHSFAPLGLLLVLWVLLKTLHRAPLTPFYIQLLFGLLGALLAFVLQGKGYPYQRYPFLALLLLVMSVDFDNALDGPKVVRWIGLSGLAMSLLLGGRFLYVAGTFSPETPFQDALSAQLVQIGQVESLQMQVQCLDTFGGCVGVLYSQQLVQSTGFLYDCYAYGGPGAVRDRYRDDFLRALEASTPGVIVLTDQQCFGGAEGFRKIERWPALSALLATKYRVASNWRSPGLQHWWSRRDEPTQFRIYLRQSEW